ncbi:guanine nucleotide exchange factor [Mycena rosella]|uniref:Guanine nucleotide exchange factor n=1 Tax=Mycena rosella TaxID=1033263 RepID=A0AAD7DUI8_MYCRO|nr:guanine nucleotide exchange factor [Mycena rosella]
MSTLLQQYQAASAADVQPILNTIVAAQPFTFDAAARSELIQLLLKDLKASKGRISSKDAALALLAVKTLGKNPTGSEVLGTAPNLSILLGLVASFKDDPEASGEALRCIANAMLLIERARSVLISKEVNGGETCIVLLQKSTNPDQIFTLSRILFLATVHPSSFITALVEEKHHGHTVIDIISGKLDLLVVSLLSGTKMAREAMVDVLKFTFNILMHYPKSLEGASAPDGTEVIGDNWSPKLDPILPPLLRVFHALPPTFPAPVAAPLTHVIHCLITIPVSPSLRPEWFGSSGTSSPKDSPKGSPKGSPKAIVIPPSPRRADSSGSSRTHSPVRPSSPKHSTLDRALSVLAAGRRSLSRSPSPIPPDARPSVAAPRKPPADTLLRAHSLLEVAFLHYFPDAVEPDDPSVRERAKAEAGPAAAPDTLDDALAPLVVLLTRLCTADAPARVRTREWLVPADLDRSAAAGALEGRADLLGRCLRLLGSVYHARLKDAVGELLFAVCDSDATTLATLLGYGNVAGFLFNKGIMSAPPPPAAGAGAAVAAAAGEHINPITGTAQVARAPEPEMTDEEKEREMEKLFVLFDRLERNGALPASQNPVRKAIEKAATAPPLPVDPDDG